jgi:hypothetical protein
MENVALIQVLLFATSLQTGTAGPGCRPAPNGEKPFLVTGIVRDSATAERLNDAHVVALSPVRRGLAHETKTDARGAFNLCVLRSEKPVHIYAEFQHRVSRAQLIDMSSETDSSDIFLAVTRGSAARISGRTVEAGTTHAVKGVQVAIQDLGLVQLSTSNGHFLFSDVPPGEYSLQVNHLAYTTYNDSLVVEPGALLDLTVQLATNVIPVDPIVVNVLSPRLDRVGFYKRQRGGNGSFITRADIRKMNNIRLPSDIVRSVRGVEVVHRPGGRGFRVVGRNMCPYRYFVDDVRIGNTFELDDIDWNSIEAIEVYNGTGQIPPQYAGTLSNDVRFCGVVVVWTRT